MTRPQRNANIGAVIVPFLAFLVRRSTALERAPRLDRPGDLRRHVPRDARSASRSASTACSPTARSRPTARQVPLRRARLDGRPGPRDRLGRRPPQAPRLHRRGGRPAQPARRPRRGCAARCAGLWHAHIGLALRRPTASAAPHALRARTCVEDAGMRLHQPLVPALRRCSGWPSRSCSATCSPAPLAGALTALLWGGLVRIFLVHHVTWSINSVCHFFGRRRFETDDQSTNVFWLALPSLGESWHHNHHAFPRSAIHGPALVGGRRLRAADPRDASGSAWPGTSSGSRRERQQSAARKLAGARAPTGRASG